jgi:predicted component of type VI protein secretion system
MLDTLQKIYPLAADQRAIIELDDYVLLEAEHQKHLSLYGEKPDYALILQKSIGLLAQGSGHFLVIISLCNALLQTREWPGFVEGLSLLNRLCKDEWPHLFPGPERLKGRIQMLDWLVERWRQFMATHPTQSLSLDFLLKINTDLNALQMIWDQQCNKEINLITIIKPLEAAAARLRNEKQAREVQQKMEQEHRETMALQESLQQNSQPISQDEYLSHLNTEELYEYASKRLCMENLQNLEAESQRYAIFKQHRAIAWWTSAPTSTHLDWDAFSAALRLKTEQRHLEALIAFETLFLQCPLFLDLQYHLCDCLESLNAEASLIAMLQDECQEFCTQHPDLEHTQIADNIPLFNKQTRHYFNLFKP